MTRITPDAFPALSDGVGGMMRGRSHKNSAAAARTTPVKVVSSRNLITRTVIKIACWKTGGRFSVDRITQAIEEGNLSVVLLSELQAAP